MVDVSNMSVRISQSPVECSDSIVAVASIALAPMISNMIGLVVVSYPSRRTGSSPFAHRRYSSFDRGRGSVSTNISAPVNSDDTDTGVLNVTVPSATI